MGDSVLHFNMRHMLIKQAQNRSCVEPHCPCNRIVKITSLQLETSYVDLFWRPVGVNFWRCKILQVSNCIVEECPFISLIPFFVY